MAIPKKAQRVTDLSKVVYVYNQKEEAAEQGRLANELFNKMQDTMVYLYNRWQDEKEYEDFKEYSKHMERKVREFGLGEFLRGRKSPFGFIARFRMYEVIYYIDNGAYKIKTYKIYPCQQILKMTAV